MDDQKCNDLGSWQSMLGAWTSIPGAVRNYAFERLPDTDAKALFRELSTRHQTSLLGEVSEGRARDLLSALDDESILALFRSWPEEIRKARLAWLDPQRSDNVEEVLRQTRDTAAAITRRDFASLSPDFTVREAVEHFRKHADQQTTGIYYAYVIDETRKLLGVVPFRQLFLEASDRPVTEIMRKDAITVRDTALQEEVAQLFAKHGFLAVPVVDSRGRMKGIITSDNVVSRIEKEATEDIQKLGGMEALGAPYFDVSFGAMVRKRAGWLMILFVGETFTATAMGYYEKEIEKAVVLALFIPLIISSGGNSGSQATTLVIRAMALGEIRLRDWWRVLYRELGSGVTLGTILGAIGLARILLWPTREQTYGPHYLAIGAAVALSLVGIVLWGTLAGAMLPFLLRRVGFDPASASAPFVATVVDVTGLVIYFTVASTVLKGILF